MHDQCSGGQCSSPMPQWHGPTEHHGCDGGCQCGGDKAKSKFRELMEATKCAKESLLKEKIKAKLEAKVGKKLDQVADLAVEMMLTKWKLKGEKMAMKETIMEKMEAIMSQGSKD